MDKKGLLKSLRKMERQLTNTHQEIITAFECAEDNDMITGYLNSKLKHIDSLERDLYFLYLMVKE